MGEQGIRDLDSKRRHPRQLTDAEREQMAKEMLTQDEQQVFRLLVRGHPRKEIAAELNFSDDAVLLHVLSIIDKLGLATGGSPPPDPPSPPVTASAALAVPRQRAEDVPTHVGKPLRRRADRDSK
jgi:DNA-binding NarL/FixJ family response regulator